MTKPTPAESMRGRACRAPVLVDVDGIPAAAAAVDVLARVQLAARRQGVQIQLRGESAALRRLIALMGLEDVLRG